MPTTYPSSDEFFSIGSQYPIVPIWREVIADTLTPVGVFMSIVGNGPGFLLESVEGGERWGRYSFVGRRPLATLQARGKAVSSKGPLSIPDVGEMGILATLEELLKANESPNHLQLPPLHGGVVGYLGYDVVREIEELGAGPRDDLGFPDACLLVIGQLAVFDHWRQRIILIENINVDPNWTKEESKKAYFEAIERLDDLARECFIPISAEPISGPVVDDLPAEVERTMSSQEFRDAVNIAKEHIIEGDIFQVVLSQRFDLDLQADPFEMYRALRLLNPSPYLYFFRVDEVSIVGSSPEPLVRLRDNVVISRPIAGSRARGADEHQDLRLEGELVEDPKELAEHIMLVDLARNDVGRVAAFGTEKVDELMTVERYSHIMHLTSQVSGELAHDKSAIDVLRATLPAGTLSGAPKVRAMEIIDQLEPTKRGIYGGVVGYLDFSGNLDTAIAIRTMVVDPGGRAHIQAGAGIVADSDPFAEDDECLHKAKALLVAVTAARRMAAQRRVS